MGKQIIIRTPNFIGDTIMMLPALELVKKSYPNAQITIVCKEHSQAVFRGKGISNIIIDDTRGKRRLKKTFRLIKEIKKNTYDLGILFHNSLLSAVIFKLARIRTIIGYEKEGRSFLLDFHLKIVRTRHYINHYACLVNRYLGNIYTELPSMELVVTPSQLIQKKKKPVIGFVLGGSNKGTRHYPINLSLGVCELLKKEDFFIVFLGDKQDEQNHSQYVAYLQGKGVDVVDLTGRTTVAEFIDSIAVLDLLVTIDTSAMHIASATDTPFLVLQGVGTSAFDTVRPKGKKGNYLYKGQSCIEDAEVIKSITPSDIYSKIVEILNKKVYI